MTGTFEASGEAYDRFVGRYSTALAGALADFAGLPESGRVLDVGAGPGALSAVLADRLGAGRVAAVEPSESFAAAFRSRLPGVELHVAGAQELPFGDGAFALVLSQLVVNFIPDPLAGVLEMARVTTAGGSVAGCVWDYAGEMTMLRAFWDAAAEVDPRGAQADEAVVFSSCSESGLARLWASAGLTGVSTAALAVRAGYADFDDLWAPLTTGVGPAGAFCTSLDAAGRAALRDAYRRRLGVGAEPFELTARAWAVSGAVH